MAHSAPGAPLPALEMLVAEMLAIHFCSDREETVGGADGFAGRHCRVPRPAANSSSPATDAVRIFWVNPVADLRAMNLLEEWGGRICGTDYMFAHALDLIPEDLPPMEALARTALADPMVGPTQDRAARIVRECRISGPKPWWCRAFPAPATAPAKAPSSASACSRSSACPLIELEIPAGL